MTVRQLITYLLECNLDDKVFLSSTPPTNSYEPIELTLVDAMGISVILKGPKDSNIKGILK